MPIEAQLPDGTILEFPDETAPEVVQARVREHLGVTHSGRPLPAGPTPAELAQSPHTQEGSAASRFMAPIGEAVAGIAHLPAALARGAASFRGIHTDWQPVVDAGDAMIEAQAAQARKGGEAMDRGDYVEGVGRGAAALLPVFGPAAADVADTAAEGNTAGALGKAAVLGASFAPAPKFADRLSGLMKNRAAARILSVMRPTIGRMATAEKVAPEVVAGVAGRETAGGIGVGTRATLAKEARRRAAQAGAEVEALQGLTDPVDVSPISERLRADATKRQTVYPTKETVDYEPVLDDFGEPLVDEAGDVVMDTKVSRHTPPPTSKNPKLVAALNKQADEVDKLAAGFDGAVPAGELFKARAGMNEAMGGGAYEKLPGQMTPAAQRAGKAFTRATSDLVHDTKFGPDGLGGSRIIDRENHVWAKAATNLENSRLRDMMGRGGKQVINLLAGRLAGAALGGATGLASGYGPMAGVAGATLGVILGESAYWGSLRAATYKDIARLLEVGDLDGAASIIQRTATTYAIDKATRERERNKRAHKALQNQAEGVIPH